MSSFYTFLAVFLGGGLGAVSRYGISLIVVNRFKSGLPIATILANVLACAIMGFSLAYLEDKLETYPFLRPLLLVGFCGGFSTFSTFSLETVLLLKGQEYGFAVANVLISVVICALVLWQFIKVPS